MRPVLKQLIVLLIIDITCGAALWYGYMLAADKKAAERELRAELVAEKEKNLQLSSMQKMLVQAKDRRQKLDQYLYSGSDLGQIKFLSELERLGRSVPGITLEVGTFEYAKTNPPSFNATVALVGPYSAIYQALRLFEEYPTNIVITRMEIRRQENVNNAGQWTATIAFSMYGVMPEIKK